MARTNALRTSVSVALAALLVVTAVVMIPGAQAVSVSAPRTEPFSPIVTVAVTFNDPDLTSLQGLRLHFDCVGSGSFSESIGQEPGSASQHAVLVEVTGSAHAGYGYLQVTQTGYGYVLGTHGYTTGVTGIVIPTGYGYDSGGNNGYGYSNGYGYGYDSGTLEFVFEMVQSEFIADEACTLVVEVVPVGNPSGDFEGPPSLPFIPRMSPIADAGLDLFRAIGSTVTLDGTLSIDPNDVPEPLSFSWEQTAGPAALDLEGTLGAEPTFVVPDALDATLTFRLTVFDGLDSASDLVDVHVGLVRAPAGQTVLEGTLVPLEGLAAPDAAVLWSVASGVPVAFDDETAAGTVFQAPEVDDDTPVVLRLTATDGQASAHAEVTFTVLDNEAPIAKAGVDEVVVAGQPATLDGGLSSDPDDNAITYAWTIESAPSGVSIPDPTAASPTLSVPASAAASSIKVATFRLTVTDSVGTFGRDTVEVGILPPGPLAANAGPDKAAGQGTVVRLSGDASTGLIESYQWTAVTIGAPVPVQVGPGSPYATFTASAVGQFTYRLDVDGPGGASSFDTVVITIGGEWFLHTAGCTADLLGLGIPAAPTNTADQTDTPGDDECIRLALPLVTGGPIDFTATGSPAALPGTKVTGDLYLSILVPDGETASLLPSFDGVSVDVSLMKAGAALGTTHVDSDIDQVAFGIPDNLPDSLPGVAFTYTRVPFTITLGQIGLSANDAFALRVDVAPNGFAYVIGVEGASASSFTFTPPAAPAGAPVANAGPDLQVNEGTPAVQLDGTGSTAGAGIAYAWTQVGGTPVTLTQPTSATPTFNAPAVFGDHNLRFRLVVTNGQGQPSNPDDVRVTVLNNVAQNVPPTASAGSDVQADEGDLVTLSGSASDGNNDFFQVRWTQPGGDPVGGVADGDDRLFFAPDVEQATTLTFRWTARDNHGAITTDDVVVTIAGDGTPPPPPVIILPPPEPTPSPLDEPSPTPTDPAPTPTDPAPTPTDPAPTPTNPGPADPAPTTPTPTQPGPSAPTPVQETDTDGDGVIDRIEIALGTNPAFAGDAPSFDITATLKVQNIDGVNVLTWPVPEFALGVQLWSSNSPYVLLATLDADETRYEDPDGKPTTKYKLTYFIEKSAAGGFLASASALASLPGWDESSAGTLSIAIPPAAAPAAVRALPAWAFVAMVLIGAALLGVVVFALRDRRQA